MAGGALNGITIIVNNSLPVLSTQCNVSVLARLSLSFLKSSSGRSQCLQLGTNPIERFVMFVKQISFDI